MITHLLKLIWNQRKSNALIITELFLIFILLWVCNYQLYINLKRLYEPIGFDYQHVYKVNVDDLPENHPAWQKDKNQSEDIYTLADWIKECPGVEAVTVSTHAIPFTGYSNTNKYNSSTGFIQVKQGEISPEFFDVFRIYPVNSSIDVKEELVNSKIILSTDAWNNLFPEGTTDYTFHSVYSKDNMLETKGVFNSMKRTAYQEYYPFAFSYLSRSEAIQRGWLGGMPEITFRVSPAADKGFPDKFKEFMKGRTSSGNQYITEIKPMEALKKQHYQSWGEEDRFIQSLFILGFFMVNILLGIVGTFWIRTEARKGEMGLRVALGSTRNELKGIMIGEALLLLSIIWLPAVLVCLHLGYIDVIGSLFNLEFIWSIAFISIGITTLIMVLMIILGVIYPAYESTAIEPAEALHYE